MKKKFHLNPLENISLHGETKTLQESIVCCTRCNACAQSCPSYGRRQEESFSPRGRVQVLRLLLEGKIKYSSNQVLIRQIAQDCILCGKCSSACAGNIPVAEQMVSLRRAANKQKISLPLKILLRFHGTHPSLFNFAASTIQLFRRLNIWIIRGSFLKFLRQINLLHRILPAPKYSLKKLLIREKISFQEDKPSYIYFPSIEACYIDPQIGLLSLQALSKKKVHVFFNISSGLFEYLYGEKALALQAAKRLLTAWEKKSRKKSVPLVTDSIEVFSFLKKYPMLFPAQSDWQKRAVAFSQQVRYIADFISVSGKSKQKASLDASSLLFVEGDNTERALKILKTHFGKNLLECEYSRFPTPLAGEIFTHSQAMLLENVRAIAQRQTERIFCLSSLAAFELNAMLAQHYPSAKAQHIVYLQKTHERN